MNIELSILDWIQTLHTPFLDKIMVFITRLGDAGIIWIRRNARSFESFFIASDS